MSSIDCIRLEREESRNYKRRRGYLLTRDSAYCRFHVQNGAHEIISEFQRVSLLAQVDDKNSPDFRFEILTTDRMQPQKQ